MLVESCCLLRDFENISKSCTSAEPRAPTFSSEIRSRMYMHLVELEAMQTVSALQNGYTAFTLNS